MKVVISLICEIHMRKTYIHGFVKFAWKTSNLSNPNNLMLESSKFVTNL